MKKLIEIYEELLAEKGNLPMNAVKHHDNDEMVQFLKSPEGKDHEFVGLDKHGKPHSAPKSK